MVYNDIVCYVQYDQNTTQAMIPMPCSQAARRQPASQRAGWTIYKKHSFETVTFPLQFPFVKWLPKPLSDQNDKKVKNQEFKKTHEFLEILDFSLFCHFAPKVARGATLQREIIREMRLCQKWIFEVRPGSQPAGQPA